jgi:anti-sigma factor RsiW
MNCKEIQGVLHGYLDGELDVVHHLAMEQHLRECPECTRAAEGHRSLAKAMTDGKLYFEAPKDLSRRVRTAVRHVNDEKSARDPWRWLRGWMRVLMPIAVAAVVLLIALPLALRTSAEDRIAQDVVASHVRSLMASHLTDVASTDQHTVKPWFNGKLTFSPPVTDLAPLGFPLIGGRLDYVDNHPAAALVYQHRKHLINLFVWPSGRGSKSGEKFGARQGYNTVHYSHDGMEFWAVSDLNRADLKDFARLVQGGSATVPVASP